MGNSAALVRTGGACLACLVLAGCTAEGLRAPPEVIFARFDPEAKKIPMPTDILRDEATGLLELDADDPERTAAEREVYRYMNTLAGWPPTTSAKVELSGQLAETSVTDETVQVWEWAGGVARRFRGARVELASDGKAIEIVPPDEGWPRGATLSIAVRGGARGVVGARGEVVECDAAFYFLRLPGPLNAHADYRAFPGATRAEREETARDLEQIRRELAPYFGDLEARGIAREEVAALWTFTIHQHTEVVMDKNSGRMPLPIDLLLDDTTGLVDLPLRDEDSARDAKIKRALRRYDGFGTTAGQLFELNAAVDPATATPETVQLYEAGRASPEPIPATVRVLVDLKTIEVRPTRLPLAPKTTYAVVLRDGLRDADGEPVKPMLTGHFLLAEAPLYVAGSSELGSIDDASARKLERARASISDLLDALGRETVAAAWPFTTLSVVDPLLADAHAAARLGVPADPRNVRQRSTVDAALLEFPLGIASLLNVKTVFEGEIATPDFLDPLTRERYEDGHHEVRWIRFMMTIPKGAEPNTPLPVVIFAHAICTERRFVLAVANELSKRGFAAIAIDLPFHGERTHCAWNGPICFPDPLSEQGKMLCPDPCPANSTCADDGKCRDGSGQAVDFNRWPVIPFPQASGAAFIDLSSLGGTVQHFSQTVVDLGALSRSLRSGDWKPAISYTLKRDAIGFLGQSLGGILGGTYVPLDPAISRAVLNVPGANLVPMFEESTYFGPHIDALLEREQIPQGSVEHRKFVNIAHWFIDAVDPLNVARYLRTDPLPGAPAGPRREVLVQMATLDFIIPNASTLALSDTGKVPRKDYVGEHAFLVVPVEPAYLPGNSDAARFLAGEQVTP